MAPTRSRKHVLAAIRGERCARCDAAIPVLVSGHCHVCRMPLPDPTPKPASAPIVVAGVAAVVVAGAVGVALWPSGRTAASPSARHGQVSQGRQTAPGAAAGGGGGAVPQPPDAGTSVSEVEPPVATPAAGGVRWAIVHESWPHDDSGHTAAVTLSAELAKLGVATEIAPSDNYPSWTGASAWMVVTGGFPTQEAAAQALAAEKQLNPNLPCRSATVQCLVCPAG